MDLVGHLRQIWVLLRPWVPLAGTGLLGLGVLLQVKIKAEQVGLLGPGTLGPDVRFLVVLLDLDGPLFCRLGVDQGPLYPG